MTLLDEENSYIFIHIDKKSILTDEDKSLFLRDVHLAQVIFVERVSVQWGAYSLVQATLNLFNEAIKYNIDYYHLISGADLPLKTWEEFNAFFEANKGTQFVSYVPEEYQQNLQKRVKYYWFFQEQIGSPKQAFRQKNFKRCVFWGVQRILVLVQKAIGVDRRKRNEGVSFRIGSEWVSITNEFLQYIVSNEQWIKKTFKYTLCPDEVFVTTLLSNSKVFTEVQTNQRYIDWGRGNPYIFRNSDYNELMHSGKLFARKFNQEVDSKIIDRILQQLLNKKY